MTCTIGLWTKMWSAMGFCALLLTINAANAQTTTSDTEFKVTSVEVAGTGSSTAVTVSYTYRDLAGRTFTIGLEASADNGAVWGNVPVANWIGDASVDATSTAKSASLLWKAGLDWKEQLSQTMRVRIAATPTVAEQGDYLVIDLSGGASATSYPTSSLTSLPAPIPTTYKTTHLVLRRIPAGSFAMHSPSDELGRDLDEAYHRVTLSQDHYVGLFEVTQRQYELVMGSNPASHPGAARPVESVTWEDVRGGTWPGGAPVSGTFLQKLRSKSGLLLDLPTESLWEYACRAGTTTAFNNGQVMTVNNEDSALTQLARYFYNGGDNQHATVGSYLPNAWGLYDMHGNVAEWCLDWYGTYPGDITDPTGAATGSARVMRGGSWYYGAKYCRAAFRDCAKPAARSPIAGFRIAMPATLN